MTRHGCLGAPAGYIGGVFDLIHVGHLEAVAQASRRVEHLTVGVLGDQPAEALSGRAPFVAQGERLEIVSHLTGVDDAVLVEDTTDVPIEHPIDVVFHADRRLGFAPPHGSAHPAARYEHLPDARETTSAILREAFAFDPVGLPAHSIEPEVLTAPLGDRDGRRVGYVPGGFDTFHIGHLNILRRARAHCDVLVAGVVEDDVLARVKGRPPVVPLRERMDVVDAISIVDLVVLDWSSDKRAIWELLRFDVIFKGDDWKGTPKGDALERDLGAVGVEVVYFPYTRTTSSTFLRQLLTA